MKAAVIVALAGALLAEEAFAVSFLHVAAPGAAPAASPAGAPGPAPGPAAPGLPVIDVGFEIMNYNFYDLPRELEKEAPAADMEWGRGSQQSMLTPEQMKSVVVDGAEVVEANDGSSTESMLLELGKAKMDPMPFCRSKIDNAPSCVRDLLEDALVNTFMTMVEEELAKPAAGPGPAPSPGPSPAAAAPGPAALLATGVAAAPASAPVSAPVGGPAPAGGASPGPAPKPPPPVHIHVTFQPGREKNLALLQEGIHEEKQPSNVAQHTDAAQSSVGRTVIAEVTIVTHTGDDVDEGPVIKAMLDRMEKNGTLTKTIADALQEATGLMAVVGNMEVGTHEIEQWNVDVCETHLKKVVKQFSVAYTRRMVPMAIYNECTNFMAKVSFSRNAHVTHVDAQRCQKSTVEFANGWDYGKNKDFDYRAFCVDVCELKYGHAAPKCHVTSGKKLLSGGH